MLNARRDCRHYTENKIRYVVGNSPAEAAAFVAQEVEKFAKIIKGAGIKLE